MASWPFRSSMPALLGVLRRTALLRKAGSTYQPVMH
jgi:hypothetical protein